MITALRSRAELELDRLALDPYCRLYLPLWKLDGDSLADHSAYGHLCTNYGSFWTPQGRSFDGNDYVDCGNKPSLDITKAITIEAWVKLPTGYTASHKMVVSKEGSAWYISIYNNKVLFSAWIDGVQTLIDGTKIVSGDIWHHVACSWDSATGKYRTYLDAQIDVDTIHSGNSLSTNTKSLLLGSFEVPPDYSFNGLIDEVRIYNRALSPAEIVLLASPSFSPVVPVRRYIEGVITHIRGWWSK